MMIRKPAQPSLARHLSLSLGLSCTVIVFVVTALVFAVFSGFVRDRMHEQAETSIAFLKEALKAPFWSLDMDVAKAVAQATVMDESVALLELSDVNGRLWFRHVTGAAVYAVREADIRYDGKIIGHVRLGLADAARVRALWGIAGIGGSIALTLVLVQYVLTGLLLRRFLRRPFRVLDTLLNAYARGDYSQTDPGLKDEEFVPLVHTLLAMGQTIQRQINALRDSEEKYRAIFDNAPVGIVRATFDGSFVDGNPAIGRMFGYETREDFAAHGGLSVHRVYAEPDARRRFLEHVMASQTAVHMETELLRKDGTSFPAILTASIQCDGTGRPLFVNSVIEDISIRKQTERELAHERLLTKAIFESVPGLLFLYDDQGRLVRWNLAHEKITGFSHDELDGRHVLDWFGGREPHASNVAAAVQRVMTDGFAELEAELLMKDGRTVPFFFSGTLVVIDGASYFTGIGIDISDRKMAEEALLESESKFRKLFESMPNGFYRSTHDGYFVDANPAYVKMLGYESLSELKKIHIPTEIYVHESERDDILSDNPTFGENVESYRLRRKDGSIILVEDNARYIKDEAGSILFHEGICRDVTERKEAEEKLRQSEEKFSRLFRLSADAIILMHLTDGRIIDANEAFSRVSGFTYEEAIGRAPLELGLYENPEMRSRVFQILQAEGQVDNFEIVLRRKDGVLLQCILSCQILTLGQRRCVMAELRDVTEFKRMQEMMIQTEKMVSVGGIAAGVAHEINNPLGIIMASSQNLTQRTRPDFARNINVAKGIGLDMNLLDAYMQARGIHEFVRNIQDAAMRAANIIRHMLDFSRRSESKRKTCDLQALIDRAIFLAGSDYDLKKSYDFKKIRIVREYDDNMLGVNCTETEIEQVLLNLLRNAAQAMATAQPEIVDPCITIRIFLREGFAVVEVEDNGPGMPSEVQRRAFEPFFTTKPPGVGTGLGLSVSYFIITRSHDGRLRLESHPGHGTKFTIELPVGRTELEEAHTCNHAS